MTAIRIDGGELEPRAGETLLQAARRVGVDVPTLCYDPRLAPVGSCRLCLVEVEGRSAPVAACAYPASGARDVRTRTSALDAYRRALLEMVLSENPPGECARCAEVGPCELHRLAAAYGAERGRFAGATSGALVEDGNPFIRRDYAQCIACYRCTAVCNDLEQAHAIVPGANGFGTRITTFLDRGLTDGPCTFCGQCVQVCPTGALMDRPRLGRARATDIERSVKTVCAFCGTGCTLFLDVAHGRIVGARPDFDSPVSRGALCVKGQYGWEFVHADDRLTTPLVREGGALRRATWDEALDRVASGLSAVVRAHGPHAFAFWSSARATCEANYLAQKFTRAVVGTNNIDNCART